MPAPRKHPRDKTDRRTVSLPAYIMAAADRVKATEHRSDFSGVLQDALVEFLKRHFPGYLEQAYASFPDEDQKPDAPKGAQIKQRPDILAGAPADGSIPKPGSSSKAKSA